MIEQGTLFDPATVPQVRPRWTPEMERRRHRPLPAIPGSATSAAAAAEIAEDVNRRGGLRDMVLALFRAAGEHGLTDFELWTAAAGARPMKEATARARRCELKADGLVVDSGRTRRGMTVWVENASLDRPAASAGTVGGVVGARP